MVIKKEKLIEKLVKKDYSNDLEEVLSKKNYKEEVKNLLLDIFYKIDASYKDYETVKKNVLSKEEYMESIIKSVKENCDFIEFIRPNDTQKKIFLVDKENKRIVCFPMAIKLLYAIAKIQKKDSIDSKNTEILNKTLTNLINIGNNINTVEPLRDFNGFAWSIATKDIENLYYNLIYQDLVILNGNKLIEEWANKNDALIDYMGLFKENLENRYGHKISKEIVELLKTISILLEINANKTFTQQILKTKEENEQELAKMENKGKYLDDLSKKKKELISQIKKVDIILNDKEKLAREYNKRNRNLELEEKIFSKRVLALKLIEEREELLSEIQKCNDKMNSKKFLTRRKHLKEELKYLKIVDTENTEKQLLGRILLFQKRLLNTIRIRIQEAKTREEITNILYEIRYLSLIPITENKSLGQITNLKKAFAETEYEVIDKAYKLKTFKHICKNNDLNINILKYIFSLNIIRLEDISLKLINEEDTIYVQFYDEDIVDERFKIDCNLDKKDLKIRFNKKIKLFDL